MISAENYGIRRTRLTGSFNHSQTDTGAQLGRHFCPPKLSLRLKFVKVEAEMSSNLAKIHSWAEQTEKLRGRRRNWILSNSFAQGRVMVPFAFSGVPRQSLSLISPKAVRDKIAKARRICGWLKLASWLTRVNNWESSTECNKWNWPVLQATKVISPIPLTFNILIRKYVESTAPVLSIGHWNKKEIESLTKDNSLNCYSSKKESI